MPAAKRGGPRGLRRLIRWIFLWLPLWFLVITSSQVLLLRWVPPVTSAFMVGRQVDALLEGDWKFRLSYRWRDNTRISRNLPIALVAAEDQTFPTTMASTSRPSTRP